MQKYNIELNLYEINILKSLLMKEIDNKTERLRQYLLAGDHFGADLIQDSIFKMQNIIKEFQNIVIL